MSEDVRELEELLKKIKLITKGDKTKFKQGNKWKIGPLLSIKTIAISNIKYP